MSKTPETAADLDALPAGTVVLTGEGFAYQKNRGWWRSWVDKGATSAMMLDPDKCGQPLTVVFVPDQTSMR